jgi:hypothetical protein
MLRAAFALCLLALAWPAAAQEAALPTDDRAAIRGVIESQLAAFNRDDGETAFSFASPGIRNIFGDVETFMQMVREGYAPVYRSREAEFRDITRLAETMWLQEVLIVGADGTVVMALYTMERQSDGVWKIAGCVLAPAREESV